MASSEKKRESINLSNLGLGGGLGRCCPSSECPSIARMIEDVRRLLEEFSEEEEGTQGVSADKVGGQNKEVVETIKKAA